VTYLASWDSSGSSKSIVCSCFESSFPLSSELERRKEDNLKENSDFMIKTIKLDMQIIPK